MRLREINFDQRKLTLKDSNAPCAAGACVQKNLCMMRKSKVKMYQMTGYHQTLTKKRKTILCDKNEAINKRNKQQEREVVLVYQLTFSIIFYLFFISL